MPDVSFFQVTLGGLLGSSVATAILGVVMLRWSRQTEGTIKAHFDERLKVFESTRAWKHQVLCELLGPMQIHFARSKSAFGRWNGKNLFLEAQVVRQANQAIRDTLLAKGHLILPHLLPHATALIEHYDVWMEEFDRVRNAKDPGPEMDFVFAGPKGYPFPHAAEDAFKEELGQVRKELYGV
ncbi:MAG TPA: hypothetical protein VGN88_09635 [Phycisphaerae bacterium]|jgi:hypothetical protein